MQDRRDFLKETMMTAAGLGVLADRAKLAAFTGGVGNSGGLAPNDVLDTKAMKPRGYMYETTAPDTFELADRARMAIIALTHLVAPETWYYDVQGVDFGPNGHPPQPRGGFDLTPKFARSIPWMRTMCGSEEFLDRQCGMMKAMLSNVREDGLLYYPIDGNRLGNTCYPDINGILALACENHYHFDGNPKWLDWIQHLASGLDKVAVRVEAHDLSAELERHPQPEDRLVGGQGAAELPDGGGVHRRSSVAVTEYRCRRPASPREGDLSGKALKAPPE